MDRGLCQVGTSDKAATAVAHIDFPSAQCTDLSWGTSLRVCSSLVEMDGVLNIIFENMTKLSSEKLLHM